MRAFAFFVVLTAAAATVADALPWLERHPLVALLLVFGLICLVGRHMTRGRHAAPEGAAIPTPICHDQDCNGDGGDGGSGCGA